MISEKSLRRDGCYLSNLSSTGYLCHACVIVAQVEFIPSTLANYHSRHIT